MTNIQRLIEALESDDVEIIIRKTKKVEPENQLHEQIVSFLQRGRASGKIIREHVAKARGIDPSPIANEVAWALVELQNSTLKRGSFIDMKGPIRKNTKNEYELNPEYSS